MFLSRKERIIRKMEDVDRTNQEIEEAVNPKPPEEPQDDGKKDKQPD